LAELLLLHPLIPLFPLIPLMKGGGLWLFLLFWAEWAGWDRLIVAHL
jgi:hypothetical protein